MKNESVYDHFAQLLVGVIFLTAYLVASAYGTVYLGVWLYELIPSHQQAEFGRAAHAFAWTVFLFATMLALVVAVSFFRKAGVTLGLKSETSQYQKEQ